MLVRTVTQDDADAVYKLICSYRQEALARDIFDGILKNNLQDPHRRLALALVEGEPVGFADMEVKLTLSRCALVAVINDLSVLESHRSQGIGTGLLISLTRQMATLGCDSVEVACPRVDVKSQAFLERNGFVRAQHLFRHERAKA